MHDIFIFDSSTVFILPNGARKSPDASWMKLDRWNKLTSEQQDGFPPIAPDFVIELVSPSDLKNQRYQDLQLKMTSDPAPNLSKSLLKGETISFPFL